MSRQIELPDALFEKLQALGGQLFTVPEVIGRLVENVPGAPAPPVWTTFPPVASRHKAKLAILGTRAPRERGATVEVDGQRIHAGTVGDLYEQVFRLILSNGKAEALNSLVPYRTSNQRYLIAREPKHPNGNRFFVDVKVGPYHIEAHKNYEQAIRQLDELLSRLEISFNYLG